MVGIRRPSAADDTSLLGNRFDMFPDRGCAAVPATPARFCRQQKLAAASYLDSNEERAFQIQASTVHLRRH
jgi:hypothetical protein